MSGEQRPQPTPRNSSHPRNTMNTIRTIKSPRFFSNQGEITSSPSDNTDTEELLSAKSTRADADDNARNNAKPEGQRAANHQDGDNVQRAKNAVKTVQIRSPNYTRPL